MVNPLTIAREELVLSWGWFHVAHEHGRLAVLLDQFLDGLSHLVAALEHRGHFRLAHVRAEGLRQ